jgi:putative redox protein
MGEQRLVWTGEENRFEGFATYGPAIVVGDHDGVASKPSDLLPLSLAACTAYDVVVILRKQRQDLRALEVISRSQQDPEPPWSFRRIHLHFVLTGDVDDAKADRAIALAESKYCAVAATLRETVELSYSHEIHQGERRG